MLICTAVSNAFFSPRRSKLTKSAMSHKTLLLPRSRKHIYVCLGNKLSVHVTCGATATIRSGPDSCSSKKTTASSPLHRGQNSKGRQRGLLADAAVIPLGLSTAAARLYEKEILGLPLPTAGPKSTGKTLLIWGDGNSVGSSAIQLAVASSLRVTTTASKYNVS
jgi:hypothetical protein